MNFVRTYKFTIMCSIAILVLSIVSFPSTNVPRIPHADKIVHFAMYAVLSVALLHEIHGNLWRCVIVALCYAALFGGMIELLQEYCTTTRSGDWLDWLADVVGALAICVVVFLKRVKER